MSARLLETMRAENGEIALLGRHLARLDASAGAFAYPFDAERVRGAVAEALGLAASAPVHRVRLTLGPDDTPDAEAIPLGGALWTTAWICPEPLEEAGTLLCVHKTTEREHYEQPYREALRRGADEAILVNLRGELVEGSRTSVWIEREGHMVTPPLAAGGLPGVARAVLLETLPNAAEAVLTPDDLRTAEAVYLSNALRGLVRVRLLPESGPDPPEYARPPTDSRLS